MKTFPFWKKKVSIIQWWNESYLMLTLKQMAANNVNWIESGRRQLWRVTGNVTDSISLSQILSVLFILQHIRRVGFGLKVDRHSNKNRTRYSCSTSFSTYLLFWQNPIIFYTRHKYHLVVINSFLKAEIFIYIIIYAYYILFIYVTCICLYVYICFFIVTVFLGL